jgi:hypothetical protein
VATESRRNGDPHPTGENRVYGITTAETSHSVDIARRQKQYVLTMLARIVGLVVLVLVPGISWPVKVVLGLAVTIIPYVAVVRANGGPGRGHAPTNLLVGPARHDELGPGQQGLPGGPGIGEPQGDPPRDDTPRGGGHVAGERATPPSSDSGHTADTGASQSSTVDGSAPVGARGPGRDDNQRADQASRHR